MAPCVAPSFVLSIAATVVAATLLATPAAAHTESDVVTVPAGADPEDA